MAIQNSVAVRNARLDSFETAVGTLPVLKIFTGAQPANCAAANTGTEVYSASLPSDWLAAASGGTKGIAGGPWAGTATGNGTAAHYRIYATGGTVWRRHERVKRRLRDRPAVLGHGLHAHGW